MNNPITNSPAPEGCPAPICSQKRATPETDSVWADKAKNILEHARQMERERDAALARESALLEFMEVEMGWEYFRAEYNIGDSPSQSLQNAKKVKEFLSANDQGRATQGGRKKTHEYRTNSNAPGG